MPLSSDKRERGGPGGSAISAVEFYHVYIAYMFAFAHSTPLPQNNGNLLGADADESALFFLEMGKKKKKVLETLSVLNSLG